MAPPPAQIGWAQKYGAQYHVDPRLLLAIGGHETAFGTLGAGRQGYTLGYGVTDSGILSKYRGPENQYRYAAQTLAKWGVHTLADVLAGKAAAYATDPAWEQGVASTYRGLRSVGGAAPVSLDAPAPLPPMTAAPPIPAVNPLPQGVLSGINQAFQGGQAQGFVLPPITSYQRVTPPVVDKGGSVTAPRTRAQPATPVGNIIVNAARQQLGQPYVWGGESRSEGGFDCSGLVDWALRQEGYKGPRLTTYSIAKLGTSVPANRMKPGDLILVNHGEHVVIYAGGGKVIAAPHTGTVVQVQPLARFRGSIVDVRRF